MKGSLPPAGQPAVPQPNPAADPAADLAPDLAIDAPLLVVLAVAALLLSGFFAMLRVALERSSRSRVLAQAASESQRERLLPLLGRAESLATSAGAFKITADLAFTLLVVLLAAARTQEWSAAPMLTALLVAVPALLLFTEILPGTFARGSGDRLLLAFLPSFYVLQLPFGALVYLLELVGRALRRALRIPEDAGAMRELVEDLRDVIADSDRDEHLDQSEREIIENVMEFHDVDAAEVMTPRTEIVAVERGADLQAVISAVATSGHSRIPVYEGNLDSVIGSVSARDIIQRIAKEGIEGVDLAELLRPATFVPETKLVSELLSEFRRDKQKMAVVLDEYGGTAGLVTMGDILTEIVGEIPDEFDREAPAAVTHLSDGVAEVDASTRISEVNEELDLELPEEEDFETLAGFVLAVLGHFPKSGESFEHQGCEFKVIEANDRRVLRVLVRRPVAQART